MDKEYKCNHCKRISTVLTLGDMYSGCAYCGYLEGFMEREVGKKKWKPVMRNGQTDALNRFMNTGELD